MLLTYKYRIKDKSARKTLRRHAFAVNQVWNYCNGYQKDIESRYRAGAPKRKWPTHIDFQKLTGGVSRELWIHAQTVQCVCRKYVDSRNKVKRALRFRISNGPRRSLGWVPFQKQSRQIDGNSITYLGKRYRFFGHKRRPLPEIVKGGEFIEDSRGRWYVCFHVEVEEKSTGNGEIGIDLGLKTLATCSNGDAVSALQHFRKYEKALAVAQRAGNKRRVKAIHAKIANARRDQLHKATSKIAAENELIVVGNVNAAKLAKTRMAKSVLDAGWSMFRNMLEYKASRHRARYVETDERWTSVTCSACGARSGPQGQKGLRIREWTCDCGTFHDRDVNAAKNILALSTQRRVDGSRRVLFNEH